MDDAARDDRLRDLLEAWFAREEEGQPPAGDLLRGEDPLVVERFLKILGRAEDVLSACAPVGSDPALPVERLGPYRLVKEIGAGGMGRVFAAEDTALGRPVAVKLLAAGPDSSPVQRARFRREAAITAALDHRNIVPIHAVGEEGPWLYIVMKLVEGPGLVELAPLPARETARVGVALAHALHVAHEHGILHRDVKPSNVLMDGGEPVLLDFGLARPLDGGTLTHGDVVPGTLPYMSPEQLRAEPRLDPRTDVYSLAATLYEVLTGLPPFDPGLPREALMRQVLERDPPPPPVPRADRDLVTILQRALEKDRRLRFGTAEAMADDLERFLAGKPIRSRPSGLFTRAFKLARRHRRAMTAVAALLAVALVSLGMLAVRMFRDQAASARDLDAVEARIEAGELRAAGDLLALVEGRDPGNARTWNLRRRLLARLAFEDLLDGLHDFSAVRTPGRISELLAAIVNAAPGDLPRPAVDFARALASLHRKDSPGARRILAALPDQAARGPAASALCAAAGSDGQDVGAEAAGTPLEQAQEHVFVAMALRLAGRPVEEQWTAGERAFAADPTDYRVLLARARLLLDRGEADHALGIYESLHREGEHRPVVAFAAARACLDRGDVEGAEAWISRAPKGRSILRDSLTADVLRHRRDPSYASFLGEAAGRWPDDPEFLRLLGHQLREQSDLEGARARFGAAKERALTPDDAALASVLILEIRYQQSAGAGSDPGAGPGARMGVISELQEIIASRPMPATEAAAHYLLGRILETEDGPAAAMHHLAEAHRLDPGHQDAVFSHARLLADEIRTSLREDGAQDASRILAPQVLPILFRLEADIDTGHSFRPEDGSWLALQLASVVPGVAAFDRALARYDRLVPAPPPERAAWRKWLVLHRRP